MPSLRIPAWAIVAAAALTAPSSVAAQPVAEPPPVPAPERLEAALREGRPALTAEGTVQTALGTSPSVEQARATVRAAEAATAHARAALLPRTTLSAHYSRVGGFEDGSLPISGGGFDPQELQSLVAGVDDPEAQAALAALVDRQASLGDAQFRIPRDQVLMGVTVELPLSDMIGALRQGLAASRVRVEGERLQVKASRADVALAARRAFYRYAQARGTVEVARASVERARAHHERVGILADAGRATRIDVLELAAHLAKARSGLAEAEASTWSAAVALAALLHRNVAWYGVDEPLLMSVPEPVASPEALAAHAREHRPDVQAMALVVRAQGHRARAAGSQRFPRLGAFASYDYGRPHPLVVPPDTDFQDGWRIGAQLSWSPDGMVRASRAQAEAQAVQARLEAQLTALEDRVRVEVLQAWHRQRAAAATHRAATEEVRAARTRYEARADELHAGRVTATALLDAETDVVRAQLALLQAAAETRIARAQLWHATGRYEPIEGDASP